MGEVISLLDVGIVLVFYLELDCGVIKGFPGFLEDLLEVWMIPGRHDLPEEGAKRSVLILDIQESDESLSEGGEHISQGDRPPK